jgi:hypothetical protein
MNGWKALKHALAAYSKAGSRIKVNQQGPMVVLLLHV